MKPLIVKPVIETYTDKVNQRKRALEVLELMKKREAELKITKTEKTANCTHRTYKTKKSE